MMLCPAESVRKSGKTEPNRDLQGDGNPGAAEGLSRTPTTKATSMMLCPAEPVRKLVKPNRQTQTFKDSEALALRID
jgi:hypothetical protein